ncbi:MAG: hypothetical protein ABIH39_01050 [Candidatus Margulisiibacteriota bacterium]
MSKMPSMARIGYLDPDKAEAIDKGIQKSRLERENKNNPTEDLDEQVKSLKNDILSAERRFRGEDQEPKIFVEGSFKKTLNEKGFEKMDRAGSIKALHTAWNDRLKKENMKDRHVGIRSFILSPDAKRFNELTPTTQKEALKQTITQSMEGFQNKYLDKGDKLTYAYSFHMDKKDKDGKLQPHAHIYLYPYSDQRKYVSLNAGKYNKSRNDINKNRKTEDKFMWLSGNVERTFEAELSKTKTMFKESSKELTGLQPAMERAKSLMKTRDWGPVR